MGFKHSPKSFNRVKVSIICTMFQYHWPPEHDVTSCFTVVTVLLGFDSLTKYLSLIWP